MASADSKYGRAFCGSTGISAAAEHEKASENFLFCRRVQCGDNRDVKYDIRTVMVNRSAQVETAAGLTDTESEGGYQM